MVKRDGAESRGVPVLALRECSYAYDEGRRVFDAIDMRVPAGARICLLGANGSGKTTLLRLLAGALRPDAGVLELDGARIRYRRGDRTLVRRTVQLALQDPDDQIFATSVYADVSYGPVNLGLSEAEVRLRVEEALAATEITDLAERVPHLLSYGQRKRVALAGALAMRPRVLLLDEPSAGLDPAGVARLFRTLDALSATGTAVVMATHDVDLAYAWADTAAVLHESTMTVAPATAVFADAALVRRARLTRPWGVVVGELLGRPIRRRSDLGEEPVPGAGPDEPGLR